MVRVAMIAGKRSNRTGVAIVPVGLGFFRSRLGFVAPV
jgi:hypothetical protein